MAMTNIIDVTPGADPSRPFRYPSFANAQLKPLLVTPQQAAQLLGFGRAMICKLIRYGELETVKFGPKSIRVTMASIEAAIAQRLRRAGTEVDLEETTRPADPAA
jgi:excisionase family DNA binding protein